MLINPPTSRIVQLCAFLALLGLTWQVFRGGHVPHLHLPSSSISTSHQSDLMTFWDALSKVVLEAKPTCALPEDHIEALINNFAGVGKSFDYRPDLLRLPQEDVVDLRDSHTHFVTAISQFEPQMPFAKGTKGIVTTAAGEFMPILVVSLRMLRRTGSTLPVHVFLESRDVYEEFVCEEVLQALDATCFVMSDILDAVPQHVDISRYQLKAFAMLFSSFDEILLLDADNLAVEQPENLLSAEPFISTGFVSWPDYWANTASPIFYDISSQPIPSVSTRASSESGQLLLSKSKHAKTLSLALYYNYYGPSHYYKLLSQGAVGEGDKETYLAAAMSLNSSFSTVGTNIETLGYEQDNGQTKGCAAVQHNPSDDLNVNGKEPGRSFVHAQTYKMDASKVVGTFEKEIKKRMWGPEEAMVEKFGRDLEEQLWADTLYTGCKLENRFKTWENKTGICTKIEKVYKSLFE